MLSNAEMEIWVLLDTSALYIGSECRLVNDDVANRVRSQDVVLDPREHWFIPRVVLEERRYQMLHAAKNLLPNTIKLGKLLGHDLCTDQQVKHAIDDQIDNQLKELGLKIVELDYPRVNLELLAMQAVRREPPFSADPSVEKGFRDALILETFMQKLDSATNEVKLVIFVVPDNLLRSVLLEEAKDYGKSRVLSSFDELDGLVNTYRSDVTEEYVQSLLEQARVMFFNSDNNSGLFYKDDVKAMIESQFALELSRHPEDAVDRKDAVWRISSPKFVSKERDRVSWMSRIEVSFTVTAGLWSSSAVLFGQGQRVTWRPLSLTSQPSVISSESWRLPLVNAGSSVSDQTDPSITDKYGTSLDIGKPYPEISYSGRSSFAVTWSAEVDENSDLDIGKVEKIESLGTEWVRD